jgi:hypothetical protein
MTDVAGETHKAESKDNLWADEKPFRTTPQQNQPSSLVGLFLSNPVVYDIIKVLCDSQYKT